MNIIKNNIILLSFLLFTFSCVNNKDNIKVVKVNDANNNHIIDSIYINNYIHKIVYIKFYIDSIVFSYDTDNRLVAKNTYKKGVRVFENIEYFSNGNINIYEFIDADNEYHYIREYDKKGMLIKITGNPFFNVYLDSLDFDTQEIKLHTDLGINVFFPNPPNYKPDLYVVGPSSQKWRVFHVNKFVPFLKQVSVSNNKIDLNKPWNSIRICMDMQGKDKNDIYNYCMPELYYKIIK